MVPVHTFSERRIAARQPSLIAADSRGKAGARSAPAASAVSRCSRSSARKRSTIAAVSPALARACSCAASIGMTSNSRTKAARSRTSATATARKAPSRQGRSFSMRLSITITPLPTCRVRCVRASRWSVGVKAPSSVTPSTASTRWTSPRFAVRVPRSKKV